MNTKTRDGESDCMSQYFKDKNIKKEYRDKLKKLYQEKHILLTTHRIKIANLTTERDKLKEKIKKSEQNLLQALVERDILIGKFK